VSDEHIRCGFEQEKTSQSDDDQRGEVDVSLAIDQVLHGHPCPPGSAGLESSDENAIRLVDQI
jgi:hypothetical protein